MCRTFRHLRTRSSWKERHTPERTDAQAGKDCWISPLNHKAIPGSWSKRACREDLEPLMSPPKTTFQRNDLQAQLRTPLDALRAALESIANSLEAEHPHLDVVERGIDQIVTLSQRVQDLIDEVAPLNMRSKETTR